MVSEDTGGAGDAVGEAVEAPATLGGGRGRRTDGRPVGGWGGWEDEDEAERGEVARDGSGGLKRSGGRRRQARRAAR